LAALVTRFTPVLAVNTTNGILMRLFTHKTVTFPTQLCCITPIATMYALQVRYCYDQSKQSKHLRHDTTDYRMLNIMLFLGPVPSSRVNSPVS